MKLILAGVIELLGKFAILPRLADNLADQSQWSGCNAFSNTRHWQMVVLMHPPIHQINLSVNISCHMLQNIVKHLKKHCLHSSRKHILICTEGDSWTITKLILIKLIKLFPVF